MLVLAIILVLFVNNHTTQANIDPQLTPQTILTGSAQDLSAQLRTSGTADVNQTITNSITLDDNTLAAMIAAENAALTAPQYMSDLPIINK